MLVWRSGEERVTKSPSKCFLGPGREATACHTAPGDSACSPCCLTPCQRSETVPDAKGMQRKLDQKISRVSKLHSSHSDLSCGLWFESPDTQAAACFCDMSGCLRSQPIQLLGRSTQVPLWGRSSSKGMISLFFFFLFNRTFIRTPQNPFLSPGE